MEKSYEMLLEKRNKLAFASWTILNNNPISNFGMLLFKLFDYGVQIFFALSFAIVK